MKNIKTALKSTLIIDHEEFGNSYLKDIFQEHGLYLDIVSPHSDLLNILDNKKFDCLLLNSDLLNNLTDDIINKVKCFHPSVMVILLLKNPSYEKIFHFVRLGVDDFILKPYNWSDLEKLLTHYYF